MRTDKPNKSVELPASPDTTPCAKQAEPTRCSHTAPTLILGLGNILLRAIIRALTKYTLSAAVENNSGDVAGKLVNIFTAAAEKADTRSWITLPKTIHITRLLVDPGVHELEVRCYDAAGSLLETVVFDDVRVAAGEVRFLSHRTF